MRYYCHCLNVNIDVLDVSNDQETITQLVPVDIVQIVNAQHEWLLCDVPSDQSVHVTWKSLFCTVSVRDLKVNRCLGCHLYTHVTNIAPSRMLINKDLLDEATARKALHDSSYSHLAKIILPSKTNSISMPRLSTSLDESVQRECDMAQGLCRQATEDAQRETEEKIRIYQREQEDLLEKRTDCLKKELDKLLCLMRSTSRNTSNMKGSPTLQTSSSYINENSSESGFGSDIFDINAADIGNRHSTTIERTLSERNTNIDDETNDDPMLDSHGWYTESSNISNFATSLPKTIALRPSSTYVIPRQDDDGGDDIERIGKSFRDLSRSMCTDGTEVFGELPSPRLNARAT